jgi:hypothetical protein
MNPVFHEFLKHTRGGVPINSGEWRGFPTPYASFEMYTLFSQNGINGGEMAADCALWIDMLIGGDTIPIPVSCFYASPFRFVSRIFLLLPAKGKQYVIAISPTILLAAHLGLKFEPWVSIPDIFLSLIAQDAYIRRSMEDRPLGAAKFLPPQEDSPSKQTTAPDAAYGFPRAEMVVSISMSIIRQFIKAVELNPTKSLASMGILEVWVSQNDILRASWLEPSLQPIYTKWQEKCGKSPSAEKLWAQWEKKSQPLHKIISKSPAEYIQAPSWLTKNVEADIAKAMKSPPKPLAKDPSPPKILTESVGPRESELVNFIDFYRYYQQKQLNALQKKQLKDQPGLGGIKCIESAQHIATFLDSLTHSLLIFVNGDSRSWIAQSIALQSLLREPPKGFNAHLFVYRNESAELPFANALYPSEKVTAWPAHCVQEYDLEKLVPFLADLHAANNGVIDKALAWVHAYHQVNIHINCTLSEIFTPIEEEFIPQFYIPAHNGFLWTALLEEYLPKPADSEVPYHAPVPAEWLKRALYWKTYYTSDRGWKALQELNRIREKTPFMAYEIKLIKHLHRPAERAVHREQVIPHVQSEFRKWLDDLEEALYQTYLPTEFQNISVESLWEKWADEFAKTKGWKDKDFEEDYILDPSSGECETLRGMLRKSVRSWLSMGIYRKSLDLIEPARILDIDEDDLEDDEDDY